MRRPFVRLVRIVHIVWKQRYLITPVVEIMTTTFQGPVNTDFLRQQISRQITSMSILHTDMMTARGANVIKYILFHMFETYP